MNGSPRTEFGALNVRDQTQPAVAPRPERSCGPAQVGRRGSDAGCCAAVRGWALELIKALARFQDAKEKQAGLYSGNTLKIFNLSAEIVNTTPEFLDNKSPKVDSPQLT